MSDKTTEVQGEAVSFRVRASRDRWHAVGLFVASVPVALVIPFLFVRLIGSAWDACLDLKPGGWLGLFGLLVLLVIVGWWLFWAGALLAWRFAFPWRVAAGIAAVVVMCVVATWLTVPYGDASDYDQGGASAECGPGGIPTWWPAVLPHH